MFLGNSPDEGVVFCFDYLRRVSRSFATVIEELGPELRTAVCVFYLVLRGLDTIEDDTTLPVAERVAHMRTFASNLRTKGWTFSGAKGKVDEVALLARFDLVGDVFRSLHPRYRAVVQDITNRMCEGMIEFAERPVATYADYNLYCHYVAGLVGIGLSQMFVAGGEPAELGTARVLGVPEGLANRMGLHLQKTNIIRDYLEDVHESRAWWPVEIWQKYVKNLPDLYAPGNEVAAVHCLNEMITDALELGPSCLEYMAMITHDQQNLSFCAIPQAMAIGTLNELYGNYNVFRGVVKLRKGLSCRIMLSCRDMASTRAWFRTFALAIRAKIRDDDPNAKRTRKAVDAILALTKDAKEKSIGKTYTLAIGLAAAAAAATAALATNFIV
jgi:farnesyl-diphosphate farnesyltransferase